MKEVWFSNKHGNFYPGMRYKALTTSHSAGRVDEFIEVIYCGLLPSGRARIKYIKGCGYERVNETGGLELNRLFPMHFTVAEAMLGRVLEDA